MKKPRVFITLPTFTPRDAVSNDALGMWKCLRSAGYDARIFASCINPPYDRYAQKLDLNNDTLWRSTADILIYHHAIYWEAGEILLARTTNKVAIKYHNVTPPHFFKNYDDSYYQACLRGVDATRRLARHPTARFWGDSAFNATELIQLGADANRCRILPPFHRIEDELAQAPLDTTIIGDCRRSEITLLFVGAVRPNKGHMKAVDVLAAYRRTWHVPSRLIFAGTFDDKLRAYADEVIAYAAHRGVSAAVHFHFSLTPSQLRAYYLASTLFLCTSDHEGFCVPLVEAMYFRLPIVAWANTAVGGTCSDAGVLLHEFDAIKMAGALEECRTHPVMTCLLASRARERYESAFQPKAIGASLFTLLEEMERQ